MADALLDKSLDDLIAERSTKRPPSMEGKRAAPKASSRAKPAGSTRPARAQQQARPAVAVQRAAVPLRVQGKKISKPTGRARGNRGPVYMAPVMPTAGLVPPPAVNGIQWIPVPAGMAPPMLNPAAMAPVQALPPGKPYTPRDPDADRKWVHDLFDAGPVKRMQSRMVRPPTVVGTKLSVSNLADAVTQDDVKELFADKGELLSAKLHYDPSGRSTGEATIVYKDRAAALDAISTFNGVHLDGQELMIKLVDEQEVTRLTSGLRVTKPGGSARPARTSQGPSRILQAALPDTSRSQGMGLPRGMGDPAPSGSRRGPGPGPRVSVRVKSGVTQRASMDDMQE